MSGATMAAKAMVAPSTKQVDAQVDAFVDVRDPHTGKLLFRYDPARRLIEVVRRGVKTLIDLSAYDC